MASTRKIVMFLVGPPQTYTALGWQLWLTKLAGPSMIRSFLDFPSDPESEKMWAHYQQPLKSNHQGPESWSPFAVSFGKNSKLIPNSRVAQDMFVSDTVKRCAVRLRSFPGTRPSHVALPISCKCLEGLHNICAFVGFQNRGICGSDGHLLSPAVFRDASLALIQQPAEAGHYTIGLQLDSPQLQHRLLPRFRCLKRHFLNWNLRL